jgi:hypothetical protein
MAIQAEAGAGWITPERQLERLIRSDERVIAEVAGTRDRPGPLPVLELASIVAQYAADNLSPSLTNWHTALHRFSMLPDKIPPLHDEVSDTGLLYLRPPGSLNELEAHMSAYGEAHLAEYGGKNPFQFKYFWEEARDEHGDVRSNDWQWVLFKGVLEGSRNQPYEKQAEMVAELSARALVHYEVPTALDMVMVAFLHKVATGESILQAANEKQNRSSPIYTRVQETTWGYHLAVGGFYPDGLCVGGFGDTIVSIAALRKC